MPNIFPDGYFGSEDDAPTRAEKIEPTPEKDEAPGTNTTGPESFVSRREAKADYERHKKNLAWKYFGCAPGEAKRIVEGEFDDCSTPLETRKAP